MSSQDGQWKAQSYKFMVRPITWYASIVHMHRKTYRNSRWSNVKQCNSSYIDKATTRVVYNGLCSWMAKSRGAKTWCYDDVLNPFQTDQHSSSNVLHPPGCGYNRRISANVPHTIVNSTWTSAFVLFSVDQDLERSTWKCHYSIVDDNIPYNTWVHGYSRLYLFIL